MAELLGVRVVSIVAWENGRAEPKVSYLPRIYSFLGYYPPPVSQSFGDRLREKRRRRGLTQAKLARQLGVGTCSIQRFEYGEETNDKRVLAAVKGFVETE